VTDASKEAEVAAQAAAEEAAVDLRITHGMKRTQRLALFATAVVIAGALWLVRPDLDLSGTLVPDKAGSYLSGVVALLALVWLVAGYHLQRLELEAQRYELRRQARETHDLVDAARLQLEIELERASPIVTLRFASGVGYSESRMSHQTHIRCDVEREPARKLWIDGGTAFDISRTPHKPPVADIVIPGADGYYQWPIDKDTRRIGGVARVSYRIGQRRDVTLRFQLMPDHTFRQLADDEDPAPPT
jgi:hypothetical protein